VSDGNITSKMVFQVDVKDKNKAPEFLSNISNQQWNEDTNITLNLSKYFYDHDGDD